MADRGVLLDTCAVIWIGMDEPMSEAALAAIRSAAAAGGIYVSAATAWELSMLHARGRLDLRPDPRAWFAQFVGQPALRLAELTADILVDSNTLPGEPPPDPFDRMLLATSRRLGVPIITRDGVMLRYAEAGHVELIRA